jgi:hypothetical protein
MTATSETTIAMQKTAITACRRKAFLVLLALSITMASGMPLPGAPLSAAALAGPGQIIVK